MPSFLLLLASDNLLIEVVKLLAVAAGGGGVVVVWMKLSHARFQDLLDTQRKYWEAEYERLKADIAELKRSVNDGKSAEKFLTEQNTQLKIQNGGLLTTLETLKEARQQLIIQNEGLRQQNEQLNTQNKTLETLNETLTLKAEQLDQINQRLTEQNENLRAQHQELQERRIRDEVRFEEFLSSEEECARRIKTLERVIREHGIPLEEEGEGN